MKTLKNILFIFSATLFIAACSGDKNSNNNGYYPPGNIPIDNSWVPYYNSFSGSLNYDDGRWRSFLKEVGYCWHEQCKLYRARPIITASLKSNKVADLQRGVDGQVTIVPINDPYAWAYSPSVAMIYSARFWMINNNAGFIAENLYGSYKGWNDELKFTFTGLPDADRVQVEFTFAGQRVAWGTLYRQ